MDKYESIRNVGEQSTDGVFIYTLSQNRFIYNNQSFNNIFRILGPGQDAVHGLMERVLTEDKTYIRSKLDELKEKGSISSTEFRIRFDDENVKHLCCDIYRLDEDSVLVGFIKDVTKTKEHENFLVEYTAKKDTFLDMITHNLSGPLNLSQNILGWVEKSLLSKGDVTSLIGLLHESLQECIDIVNDFLKEEHRESQLTFVRKTRFDIAERLEVIIDKLKELNPEKEFLTILNIENQNINTDSVKFFQVIHNLLSNAIKFTPAGGRITITVDEETEAFLFTVADNGIGIPDALKPYIFSNRGLASRDGLLGEPSHGIGLFLIKKLVELIGGTIWFESKEQHGTSFFVKLPKV